MDRPSRKLSGSIQGALAGGGDPATSPLYVFGPFLKLLVAGGALSVSFGASIWLAVLTVVTASAMYRLVMRWVTDGSGGSGLSEEEFGAWAVKVNASITVIEYTLTFLVSMAALVTFVTDRVPGLNAEFFGLQGRALLAIGLSLLTGVLVNRGPKTAARAFGPATAAVLLLLWALILATVWRRGINLPDLRFEAFSRRYIGFTLGGYARILALMTGVEIFANLVAAYDGSSKQRARKAFGSLVIVMGTTVVTMLVVGPAIRDLSNPNDASVSVFTQAMDQLLPEALSHFGTLIGVAVLLSAAAASAQGLQNLALGLRYRHYIPALIGQRNRFGVADKPVWFEVGVCSACFLVFGTAEDTYLSLYAAGVFILLSLTGWAAVKRLRREIRRAPSVRGAFSLAGTLLGVVLTSVATVVIFAERFREGAWAYALLVPVLYAALSWFRSKLGAPRSVEERLGRILCSSILPDSPQTGGGHFSAMIAATGTYENLLIPLDRAPDSERAIPLARSLARTFDSDLTLLTVLEPASDSDSFPPGFEQDAADYLGIVAAELESSARTVRFEVVRGDPSEQIGALAAARRVGAVVMSLHGRFPRWVSSGVLSEVLYQTTPPVIVVRPAANWRSTRTRFQHLLVALDGSELAEQVIPYVLELSTTFGSKVTLLSVSEGSESEDYATPIRDYLARIARVFEQSGVRAACLVQSGGAVQTIVGSAADGGIDLIMLVSHGRGGLARQHDVRLGSVTAGVLRDAPCPVFVVSATARSGAEGLPVPPARSAAKPTVPADAAGG